MPALLRTRALVAFQKLGLLRGSHLGRFTGIKAHGNDVEFLAHIELHHDLTSLRYASSSGFGLRTSARYVVRGRVFRSASNP